LRLRNCAQANAPALADKGKACSNAQSAFFMQRSEMKKILGKFKKSTFCFFFCFGKKKEEIADQGKACSKAQSVVFMQRSEMKKILGKFEMHFLFLFLLRKKEKILR
jgi:hypothetical protein